jgi:uncharacterized protein
VNTPYIIYHGNCYDGWGAAYIAKQKFSNAILLPGVYGNPMPEVPDGATVYMVDISYPRPQMEALAGRCNLRVLDHHKTAQAALEGFPNTVFDMNRSGAMLSWNEFFPGRAAPKLIQYVQDQDLWTWKLPDSQPICTYIRSFPRTMEDWRYVYSELESNFDSCVYQGNAIMRSEEQRVSEMCEQVQWRKLAGYTVPVVNASVQFSAVPNELCERHPEAPFAAYYFDRGDGIRQWGLRSVGAFDVSEIAKQFCGGGHKNAAGFQTKLQFEDI